MPLIPSRFDYAAPSSVQEAVRLLSSGGEGAKVLAGGQSLIPLLKLRLASPTMLVDINRIKGLEYIRESGSHLAIGALTRMADVEASGLIKKKYPIIHDASGLIGDPQVRNRGTLGGNLSHGDPENDMPAVMLALGAEFIATGPSGQRSIKAEGFFLDTFSVALAHDEILTEVKVPRASSRSGGSYLKLEQKVADFAVAGAAVQLSLGSKGECSRVGIGLTAVGPTAIKANKAEEHLLGRKPTDAAVVKEAARLAAEASDPASDIRGTAAYKKQVVQLLVARAVKIAYERARSRGAR